MRKLYRSSTAGLEDFLGNPSETFDTRICGDASARKNRVMWLKNFSLQTDG